MEKIDYKKKYKDLYMPKTKPMIVEVPSMTYIMVGGKGNPNDENGEYTKAVELLYGLTFTIKMSKMSGKQPEGYFEYVVPPLEGLWWIGDNEFPENYIVDKERFNWISMIRQPEFVTEEVFNWAKEQLKQKKPDIDVSKARLETLEEGLCVQIMHIGPYDNEKGSIIEIEDFAKEEGYKSAIGDKLSTGQVRYHHEIYLSDPRKTLPEKLQTVIRHPIKK